MSFRDYKQFAPDEYYHIYNRGNGKQNIFLEEGDYRLFFSRLKENIVPEKVPFLQRRGPSPDGYVRQEMPAGAFSLTCYCLMPNHFHFLIRQNTELPIGKLILKICTSYSKSFNKKYQRVGGLFQDTFKAVLIDSDEYLMWLSAYIHQNPKVAKIVPNLIDYPWSSYPEYLGKVENGFCEKDIILKRFQSIGEYENYTESSFEFIRDRKEAEKLALDSGEK